MGVDQYSETAASNATVLGVNIGEGCDPGNVNDAIRAALANFASWLNWKVKTAAYTLVAYDVIQADTVTTAAFSATLPATPSAGHWVAVLAKSTWAANNLTIARNGQTIRGATDDLVLDDALGALYFFYFDGTTWQYTAINLGNYLPLAGGQLTGTLKQGQGADIASAAALTLGSDGNSFDVTGTTAITSINTVGVGTVVRLQFDAALTLTHNATNLILPGGADITTAAGDIATFSEYASGDWRCISYQKADGTAVVAASDFNSIAEDILPDADSTRDLGSSSKAFAEAHIDKVLTPTFRVPAEGADRDGTMLAAAYVSIDGAATPSLFDSENVSSLTDSGVGLYDINLTQNMAATDYTVAGVSNEIGGIGIAGSRAVGSFRITVRITTTQAASDLDASAVVYGDLAS